MSDVLIPNQKRLILLAGRSYPELAQEVRSVLKALGRARRLDAGKRVSAESALAT